MTTDPTPPATPAVAPSAWNIANAVTMVRLLLVPVLGWLLLHDGGHVTAWRYAATAVFAVAMITDRIDGDLARSRGLVTDFGKVVDPIADKALVTTAMVGLSWIGDMPWWITVLVLVREWGVTLIRFIVIRHGVLPASRGGKVKTFLQAIALGLFILPLQSLPGGQVWHGIAWAVLLVALAVSLVTGADYVARALRLRRTSPRALRRRAGA